LIKCIVENNQTSFFFIITCDVDNGSGSVVRE